MYQRIRIYLVSALLTFLLFSVCSGNAMAAVNSENMPDGSYVEFGSYNGAPILWFVLDKNENGVLLLSDRILTYKAFAARAVIDNIVDDKKIWSKNEDWGDRKSYGHNLWELSSLREWLNSNQDKVDYTFRPDMYNVTANSYADEPGFLTNFTNQEQQIIVSVKQKQYLNEIDKNRAIAGSTALISEYYWPYIQNGNQDLYYDYVTDKVFLFDIKQFKEYFIDQSGNFLHNPWAYPTPEAYQKDDGQKYNYPANWYSHYWLRSFAGNKDLITVTHAVFGGNPEEQTGCFVGKEHGFVGGAKSSSSRKSMGVRPALYIQSSVQFNGDGTKDSPYKPAGKGASSAAALVQAPSPWAAGEIEAAKNYGLTTEKILSNYQQSITREEFCELAVKLYEALSGQQVQAGSLNPFSDTNNPEILKAYNLGIVAGVDKSRFAPDNQVTREQIAAMFYRTMRAAKPDISTPAASAPNFSDNSQISGWAVEAVKDMSARGIIGGVGENKFSPQEIATREQSIALVKRVYEKLK